MPSEINEVIYGMCSYPGYTEHSAYDNPPMTLRRIMKYVDP